jgi:hypothetical protein
MFDYREGKFRRASRPKSVIIAPEVLLIQSSQRSINFSRNKLILPVNRHHQVAEPRNTPHTTRSAVSALFPPLPTPMPAKMAANERMVIGLVNVSSKVET